MNDSSLIRCFRFFANSSARRIFERAILLFAAIVLLSSLARAQNAFVRVNQVGYERGTASRA